MNVSRRTGKKIFPFVVAVIVVAFVVSTIRTVRTAKYNRALIAAVESQDAQSAILALTNGADPNLTYNRETQNQTLWRQLWSQFTGRKPVGSPILISAIQNFNLGNKTNGAVLLAFVRAGVNFNVHDVDGNTPVSLAIISNSEILLDLCLSHGASAQSGNPADGPPLTRAILANQGATPLVLLKYGANPNSRDIPNRGTCSSFAGTWKMSHLTPLMCCMVSHGQIPFTSLADSLIKYRADVNAVDDEGRTALMWAIITSQDSTEMVKTLLLAGARVELRAHNGDSAIDLAKKRARALKGSGNHEFSTHTQMDPVSVGGVTKFNSTEDFSQTSINSPNMLRPLQDALVKQTGHNSW